MHAVYQVYKLAFWASTKIFFLFFERKAFCRWAKDFGPFWSNFTAGVWLVCNASWCIYRLIPCHHLLQSSLSFCTCLTVCLMWSFFLLLLSLSVYPSLSFSFCFSALLLTYGGRPGIVLTYLQLCSSPPSPDSLLFPVPIRMRHSPKLYTLNLTDIFRPALIFHSVQLRHLLETLCFLILLSELAYETIALFQCK